ncbi:MAG: hypothetical protein JWN98_1415 [Abditibacteriota bacterium]|nr:hypothetical protein [Abditibacteriota bacterium]
MKSPFGLNSTQAVKKCPYRLRRIEVYDPPTQKMLVFLTNHLTCGATTIAAIYKQRWQIEWFFKALKQNLKIKSRFGWAFSHRSRCYASIS